MGNNQAPLIIGKSKYIFILCTYVQKFLFLKNNSNWQPNKFQVFLYFQFLIMITPKIDPIEVNGGLTDKIIVSILIENKIRKNSEKLSQSNPVSINNMIIC